MQDITGKESDLNMLIEINRFMTSDEIRAAYYLPEPLADKILATLPVAIERPDGTPLYLESEVDHCLAEFVRRERQATGKAKPHAPGKPGRKDDTLEIASYAHELKRQEKTWKEILKACRERWPNDDRVKNKEQLRATWRRHFRPKCQETD